MPSLSKSFFRRNTSTSASMPVRLHKNKNEPQSSKKEASNISNKTKVSVVVDDLKEVVKQTLNKSTETSTKNKCTSTRSNSSSGALYSYPRAHNHRHNNQLNENGSSRTMRNNDCSNNNNNDITSNTTITATTTTDTKYKNTTAVVEPWTKHPGNASLTNKTENFNQHQQTPCLINLSRDHEYPLKKGVTMLGTGTGCARPDIILHGPGVAPQHCFIERLNKFEVILHPISEQTAVNYRPVSGPTPLYSGNVISIGEAHSFRYEEAETSSKLLIEENGHDQNVDDVFGYQTLEKNLSHIYYNDSPYAIINSKKGSNSINSAGSTSTAEVNRNFYQNRNPYTNQYQYQTIMGSKALPPSVPTRKSIKSPPISTLLEVPEKYRDGLESEDFGKKIKRFENFAHSQFAQQRSPGGGTHNNNLVNVGVPIVGYYDPYGLIANANARSSTCNTSSTTSSNGISGKNMQKIPPEIPKRNGSSYSATTNGNYRIDDRSMYSSAANFPFQKSVLDSNKQNMNHYYESSTYGDNEYSSLSNLPKYQMQHQPVRTFSNKNREMDEDFISCDTLLELHRKKMQEEKEESQKPGKLKLEDILAMCEEYEEQIQREIEEKKRIISNNNNSSEINSNSDGKIGNGFVLPKNSISTVDGQKSQSQDFSNTTRINGSHPEFQLTNGIGNIRRDYFRSNSVPVQKPARISVQSLNKPPTKSLSVSVSENEMPISSSKKLEIFVDNKDTSTSNGNLDTEKLLNVTKYDFRNVKNPYEYVTNCTSNSNSTEEQKNDGSGRRPIITTVIEPKNNSNGTTTTTSTNSYQLLSLESPRSLNLSNGCHKSVPDTPGSRSDTPGSTKSKLSVSFSNSIEEYPSDDSPINILNTSPGSSTSCGSNSSRNSNTNGGGKSTESGYESLATKPIIKNFIATEVQVHRQVNSQTPICTTTTSDTVKISKLEIEHELNDTFILENKSNLNGNAFCNGESEKEKLDSNKSPKVTQETSKSKYQLCNGEDRVPILKKPTREISEIEQEMNKPLLFILEENESPQTEDMDCRNDEKSLLELINDGKNDLKKLKGQLGEYDSENRAWRAQNLGRISDIKARLMETERELHDLEKVHENFCGNSDEETVLLEKLKLLHELVEQQRKSFEEAEYNHMESEVDRETQREEILMEMTNCGRKVINFQNQLEKCKSFGQLGPTSGSSSSATKDCTSSSLIENSHVTLKQCQTPDLNRNIPKDKENISPVITNAKNTEIESSNQLSNSNSINTKEKKIEVKNIEIQSEQKCVPKPSEEKTRVLESEKLQNRAPDATRDEWEISRVGSASSNSRSNQCHSLNSVGSEDSTQTISDSPTESVSGGGGSSDDTNNTDKTQTLSTLTDISAHNGNGQICQQMRHKNRLMPSQGFEDPHPLTDGSTVNRAQRPLTRFLPVRADENEFDLRLHIESAGHQLELCQHIIVNETSARGFLSKRSRFHNWNKRWFVFDRVNRTLSYYMDKGEKKSKGGVHFQAIEEVYVDHMQKVKSPAPKLTFCVKTYNRVFYLLSPSAEAMRIWIDIIFTGAEGYSEFKCAP